MFGAIAQVGPDVTTVTLTAGGASDTAEPQHGIALLIVLPPESFAGGYYVNAAGIVGAIVVLAIAHLRRASLGKAKVAP